MAEFGVKSQRSSRPQSFAASRASKTLSFSSAGSSRASGVGFIERTSFSMKEWLLVFVECLLSFVWVTIRGRRRTSSELLRRSLTSRQEVTDIYYLRGISSFGAIVAGFIADSFCGIYTIALTNVVLHFAACSLLFMEAIIDMDDYELYPAAVSTAIGISIIYLKATDFTRLVYVLQQIGKKNVTVVNFLVFLYLWMNERACGGILLLLIDVLRLDNWTRVRISFLVSALALFLYIYLARPGMFRRGIETRIGCKITLCMLTALRNKYRVGSVIKKNSWLDFAEIKYDKFTIDRTRKLLGLYSLLLPTAGFSLYATSRSDFYTTIWDRLKPNGVFALVGVVNGARIISLFSMFAVEVFLHVVRKQFKVKKRFYRRVLVGYLAAIACYFYAGCVLLEIQYRTPTSEMGHVRIFNTRATSVEMKCVEPGYSITNFSIPSSGGVIVGFGVSLETLIKVEIIFDDKVNFTTMLSVTPNKMSAYLLVDPPNIFGAGGYLPLREGPPGLNNHQMARMYIINALSQGRDTVTFSNVEENGKLGEFVLQDTYPGRLAILQLAPGSYNVRLENVVLRGETVFHVGGGGVYGILLFPSTTQSLASLDTLVPENEYPAYLTFGISIPYAIAFTMSWVTLRTFLFSNSPDWLEGLSFGFLEFLENATSWVVWMGFMTWHPFVTAETLFAYTLIVTLSFFFFIYESFKSDHQYRLG